MATGYVVDTGVFLRWFIPQVGYEHAREIREQFANGTLDLETDEFARVEMAEVLRRRGLAVGRMSRVEFLQSAGSLDDLDIVAHRVTPDRLLHAGSLAADYNLRMFDALFVQLALVRRLPLLTTDKRLRSAVDNLIEVELLRGI